MNVLRNIFQCNRELCIVASSDGSISPQTLLLNSQKNGHQGNKKFGVSVSALLMFCEKNMISKERINKYNAHQKETIVFRRKCFNR